MSTISEDEGEFIMSTINITNISESDWSAIQETLYLDSIPGMTKSILEGAKESLDDCIPGDMVWNTAEP